MKLKKMLTLAATFVATLSLAACSASSSWGPERLRGICIDKK